jgi:hypothetical protein
MSDGWVKITLAPDVPDCMTEYGLASSGQNVSLPVETAADFISRSPKDWIIDGAADRAEVNAELTRRAAPITGGGK